MSNRKETLSGTPRTAIIGAGIGGLSTAISLKRQLGYENFVIYERASDVGGTWRDNIYPGCSSDIPVHLYSLSTDLNPDWTQTLCSQPEIQAYWKQLTKKHALSRQLVFNTKVVSADWSSTEQLYHIIVQNVLTGAITSTTAEIVISAIGHLNVPRYPNIPGLRTDFKGELFHSFCWNYDVDLRGKNVAVIGSGSSGTQLLPPISEDPSVHVINFCRTPPWFVPRNSHPFSILTKWIFKHIPFVLRLYRSYVYSKTEVVWLAFWSPKLGAILTKAFGRYMLKTAPPKHHDKLTPNYPLGCKRLVFDKDYLAALHRPNVDLNCDGIAQVTADSIVSATGDVFKTDVIIAATGFIADRYPLHVRGINGQTIDHYFQSRGGPQAYFGTTIPGFPNFHIIGGPNTATGHTSLIFTEEVQINYTIQIIKPILAGKASSFEVKTEATDAHNDMLQKWLSRSLFVTCDSWYRVGGSGKVFTIFPGPVALFWWGLRRPVWDHYKAIGAERWARERRRAKILRVILGLLAFGLSGIAILKPKYLTRMIGVLRKGSLLPLA